MHVMSADPLAFNRGVIRPVECVKAGFESIKGDYWMVLGLCIVAILVGSFGPFGILLGPMMCGMHMCLLRRQRGERAGFDVLFKGFDFFVPGLIVSLLQMVPMLILVVPLYLLILFLFIGIFGFVGAVAGDAPPVAALILPVVFVVAIVVMIAVTLVSMIFMFSFQLIVDRRLGGWDSVVLSARAVLGNLGGLFGLMMLNMLMAICGLFLCYIGAFLVMPIGFAAIDQAYRRVFPELQLPQMAPPQYSPQQHPWMG